MKRYNDNSVDGVAVNPLAYSYDRLNRATSRNEDTFDYNARSEVIEASVFSNAYTYAYDFIGNHTTASVDSVTTTYTANALNQYTSILRVPAPPREPSYDLDGNMVLYDAWSYAWDAENRLTAAYSNSICVISNAYDHMNRRVLKVTPEATHTFIYDGWNLVQETINDQQSITTNRYVWGKDLSRTLQGAGGVGGLLAVSIDGAWHFPCYDNNGNITAYIDENGSIVAEYTYDAFGGTISKSEIMVDQFRFRFSTKYLDIETGLYYYGYRFYSPELHRWMNRDPIGEEAFLTRYLLGRHPIVQFRLRLESLKPVYLFVKNGAINSSDPMGLASFRYRPLGGVLRFLGVVGGSPGSDDDAANTVIGHEQIFFEEGKNPGNIGFFSDSTLKEEPSTGYRPAHDSGWNDCVMRIAYPMVKPMPYSLLGIGPAKKYNCQDWAEKVRAMYRSIIRFPAIYAKCCPTQAERKK